MATKAKRPRKISPTPANRQKRYRTLLDDGGPIALLAGIDVRDEKSRSEYLGHFTGIERAPSLADLTSARALVNLLEGAIVMGEDEEWVRIRAIVEQLRGNDHERRRRVVSFLRLGAKLMAEVNEPDSRLVVKSEADIASVIGNYLTTIDRAFEGITPAMLKATLRSFSLDTTGGAGNTSAVTAAGQLSARCGAFGHHIDRETAAIQKFKDAVKKTSRRN